ncbi:winged helix-turn-helix transcriptional regulator [Phenylobacterium sp.]|uniref:winged helix-turn-helix transcriptional regulator n=1 Tax=Phenylobacterium sp. TaxID=1871053 RepID=UPI003D2E46EF
MSDDPAMLRVGGQRPIMALLELLGRRWALRILWELRDGPLTSRALRAAAGGLAPSVLQARVNDLRGAQLLALRADGYGLTPLGRELLEVFTPMYMFSDRWAEAMPRDS